MTGVVGGNYEVLFPQATFDLSWINFAPVKR